MAWTVQQFPRTTKPHFLTLSDNIRALMGVANAGSFMLDYDAGAHVVKIGQEAWTGVDLVAVQTAIASCPDDSEANDVKYYIDNMSKAEKANFLTILDQINVIRGKLVPALGAITPAQYIAAVKAKVDTL